MADVRLDLDEPLTTSDQDAFSRQPISVRPARRLHTAVWTLTGLVAGGLLAGFGIRFATAPAPRPVTRFAFSLPPDVRLRDPMALSPDGRTLVYAGTDAGGSRLYKRALDALESVPIQGTEGGGFPFFSPDGAWVGFSDGRTIKRRMLFAGSYVPEEPGVDGGRSYALAPDGRRFLMMKEQERPAGSSGATQIVVILN